MARLTMGAARFFGSWHHDDPDRCEPPVGQLCARCEEPIEAGEPGATMPQIEVGRDGTPRGEQRAYHAACFLCGIANSLGHQQGSGNGGVAEDPPGMTKREAAEVVVLLWWNRVMNLSSTMVH
jgi:hypothetical protein